MGGLNPEEWSKVRTLVILLLVLQAVSVLLMWSLNPKGQRSETSFALLLAADLVSFSSISYLTRVENLGGRIRGALVLAGSAVVLLFMLFALIA